MAAFLKEMKSVRLRKVFNGPADMGRSTLRPNSADNSFVAAGIQRPPRPVDGPVTTGEKRKREVDTQAVEGVQSIKRRLMGPLPRSADSSFQSTNTSFSSQSQSQIQSRPEAGPSKPPRSYIPVRAWPSSSVDGTDVTPSLTSDGDPEQVPDEPLPPTPPQVSVVTAESPEEEVLSPVSSPQKGTAVPRPPTPPRRAQPHERLVHSVFDKRPPRSPLPAPTPRKARPPTRSAARRRILDESDDEDDPLAIAVPDSLLITRARRERRPAATGTGAARHTRRGSESSAPGGEPSKTARRRTLDEELRNSDDVTEDDLLAFDIEPHVYTTVGPGSGPARGRKGFLAHGGGGGIPVYMGAGTVEGVEGSDGDEDEVQIIEPLPPPTLPRRARGRTGGGVRR
jgi:hypothetical protein